MLFHVTWEFIDSSEAGQKRSLQLFSKWQPGPGDFQDLLRLCRWRWRCGLCRSGQRRRPGKDVGTVDAFSGVQRARHPPDSGDGND